MDFLTFVERNGRRIALPAGEHVFRQGDEDRSVYVLEQGLLKAYYLSGDGRETIKSFILEGELIGSLASAWRKETCSFSVVTLEPSSVLAFDFDALHSACRRDIDLAGAMIEHLLAFSMKKERRERELLTESAEHRYRALIAASPELFERVRQKDIARYLGITPVALSRIRQRSDARAVGEGD